MREKSSRPQKAGPRARWDARYREGDWADVHEPAEVLLRAQPWLPAEGLALDLACGAGRNALFLAERGLPVVAVDLSIEGLRLTSRRARDRGLPVWPVHADLERFAVRTGGFQVVVDVRFLLRSAFDLIVDALAPGGLLVFETFSVDEIDVLGGDIRREYALERGELRRAFPDLEVLVHEEGVFRRPEGERGLARLIARKRGGAAPRAPAPAPAPGAGV
ncbi:MAG: class I SAM-dependent methyltransferase [Gemmatimonadetes bacterium]|nr:class I SAM-dependent methyltransferase [Gemmatimonadota bacterium]